MSEARPAVFVTRELHPLVMQRLRAACRVVANPEEAVMPREIVLQEVAGKDGVLTTGFDRVDDEFLEAAGAALRVVANFGVGYDNVDVAACTLRRVVVSNTPGVLTETTADMAFALILAASRRITEGDRFLRSRTPWIWGPMMMLGRDVHGKVLGIVGFGRIGQAVARRARAFGMRILYHRRSRAPAEVEADLAAEWCDLDRLLADADIISLHTPLTVETRHLIDARRLRLMKPTAVLVNSARGPVVDEAALAVAIREGRIFAAGLDVFEREPEVHPALLECENTVLVPHLGSATVDTRVEMGMLAAENLVAVLEGRNPPTPVNPEVLSPGR